MVARYVHGFDDYEDFFDKLDDNYPFYCVLLYTPDNGINARLHKYVRSHWSILDRLTGSNCLLVAVENMEPGLSIEQFKPEDVYDIARYLGASVEAVPGMIFYTEPLATKDTLVLKIIDFFSDPANLTDDDLTDFFKSIQSIADKCSSGRSKTAVQRLKCLRKSLNKEWPRTSRWAERASKIQNWLIASSTTTTTVALAMDKIHEILQHLKIIE